MARLDASGDALSAPITVNNNGIDAQNGQAYHPRIYRMKVTELAEALQQPESRLEATEVLRGLVDAIVLTPSGSKEELGIELRGNVAAMRAAPYKRRGHRKPATFPCKYLWLRGLAAVNTD